MRILVIDDSEEDLRLAQLVLEQHDLGDVEVCDSPELALQRAFAEPRIDLILLDIVMPGMDGLETCRRLKSEPRSARIPVVMLTCSTDPKDLAMAFEAGAADYVRKPIDDIELPARVRRILEASASRVQLADQEQVLRSLTCDLEIGLLTWVEGKVTFTNPAAIALAGQPLVGRTMEELAHDAASEGAPEAPPLLWDLLRDGTLGVVQEARLDQPSGETTPISAVLSPLRRYGHRVGTAVAFQDERGRIEKERVLRLAAEVLEATAFGIVITDPEGVIQQVNTSFSEITGYPESEVLGRATSILRSGRHPADFYLEMWHHLRHEGAWEGDIWNRHRDGRIYPERLSIRAVYDPQGLVSNYVGVFSDISERKRLEDRLRHLAFHDPLTGLPNRTLFHDRLSQSFERTRRKDRLFALVYVDLDDLKTINDTEGHSAGDRVLCELARRLRQSTRSSDTVARIGGDEFAVILEDLAEACQADKIASEILADLAVKPAIRASIGVAIGPVDAEDADSIVQAADQAMFLAKQKGGCRAEKAVRATGSRRPAKSPSPSRSESNIQDPTDIGPNGEVSE